jgi:hypothetical protein
MTIHVIVSIAKQSPALTMGVCFVVLHTPAKILLTCHPERSTEFTPEAGRLISLFLPKGVTRARHVRPREERSALKRAIRSFSGGQRGLRTRFSCSCSPLAGLIRAGGPEGFSEVWLFQGRRAKSGYSHVNSLGAGSNRRKCLTA